VKTKAKESRLALLLLSVLVASMGGRAFAALPQNAPPGMRMYVLALRGAGTAASAAADREPDLARLGGVLVESKRDLRIIYLPPERLEELRHDPRVAFVQRVGALAEDAAAVQNPVARQTKSSPAPRPVTPASVGLTTWEYAYDGSGNVARISGTSSSAYTYDLMNRLTTATVGSAQQTYTYDAFGNRTSTAQGTDTTTFGVDPATNRLMSQTVNGTVAWTLEYDEAGHVKKDRAGHAYQFDAAGMMNRMTTTTSRNRRMIYTASDERIAVIDTFPGGKETEFTVRDFGGKVLRVWYQTDGMPLWQRDYVYADGGLIAEVRNVDAAEDPVHHFHADHLGSIRLTTAGSTGVLTRSHEFWPFGEEITSTVQESFERVQPMKFTGHERDYISAVNAESTDYLDYMHARYYVPMLGRFLSVDPNLDVADAQREPQRWNRYVYALDNPVRYTDPSGRDVYKINRELGGHRARSPYNPLTHTFVATVTDGVLHTYSWGNTPDQFTKNSWNKDKPEDLTAAYEALSKGLVTQVGGDDLDRFVAQAYEALRNDPSSRHWNLLWIPPFGMFSCKTEASRLLWAAYYYQHESVGEDESEQNGSSDPSGTYESGSYEDLSRRGTILEKLTDEARAKKQQ
jgi:RHS repeat-associated protein